MCHLIYHLDPGFLCLLHAQLPCTSLARPAWELYREELAGEPEDTGEGLDMEVEEELELDGTELKLW